MKTSKFPTVGEKLIPKIAFKVFCNLKLVKPKNLMSKLRSSLFFPMHKLNNIMCYLVKQFIGF